MKLTCLLALFGLSSGLVISPPALPRAGMATRHRALFMQEEDQPPAAAEDDQTTRCDAHQSSLPLPTRRRVAARAARHACARCFAPEPLALTRGIGAVLGGGKTTAEIEKDPIAEAGSLAAFVIVISALVFGGLNPDFVEGIAAKSAKCVDGTIVRQP